MCKYNFEALKVGSGCSGVLTLSQKEKQSTRVYAAVSRRNSIQIVKMNTVPQSLPFEITLAHTLRGGEFDVEREDAELREEVYKALWPHGFDVAECYLTALKHIGLFS